MKYIVVKSFLGFGDRLEALKMCVDYAIKHKLQIFVDWSDSIWSHKSESFYTYFSLDMPTMKLEDLEGLSVYPTFWKGRLTEKMNDTIFRDSSNEIGQLQGIYNADVIVSKCCNIRHVYIDNSFFNNIFKVIDPRIIEEVKRRQDTYKLSKCWGIHLRGTDRASNLDYKETRVTALVTKLVANGFFNSRCVIVSDDEEYIMIWKRRWGHQHPVLSSFTLGGNQGSHRITNPSISKDILNVNLLIDFFTLASCSRIFTTAHDSRFAREALKISPSIKRILE